MQDKYRHIIKALDKLNILPLKEACKFKWFQSHNKAIRTRKDTIPQYLRKLIFKKKKMRKFMKLNKSEHVKFMYKKSL